MFHDNVLERYGFFLIVPDNTDNGIVIINFNNFHFTYNFWQHYNRIFGNYGNISVSAYNVQNFPDTDAVKAPLALLPSEII